MSTNNPPEGKDPASFRPEGEDAESFRVDDLGQAPEPVSSHELELVDDNFDRLPKSPQAMARQASLAALGVGALFVVVLVAFWHVPELVAVLALVIFVLLALQVAGRHTISNLIKITKSLSRIKSLSRSEKDDE